MLHVGVATLAIFGLPELMDPPLVTERPIIVELVTVAERTVTQKPPEPVEKKPPPPAPKLKPVATPKPKPPVEKAPPPEPAKAVATPPPPPKLAKVPAPAKPVTLPKPKPVEKKAKKAKAAVKLASTEPPKAFRTLPRPRAKPKRPRRKFSADRIAALLDKNLEKKQTEPQRKVTKAKTAKPPPPSPANPVRRQARSQPMTMSEIDAIRYQIERCWSIPAGARDAQNLVVRIKIFLNTDGSLSKAPEIVGGNQSDDPFYRTAAESARRAVLKCQPLKNLPADKYANWREITLTFNPSEMLGG